jgi:hypothetical protein
MILLIMMVMHIAVQTAMTQPAWRRIRGRVGQGDRQASSPLPTFEAVEQEEFGHVSDPPGPPIDLLEDALGLEEPSWQEAAQSGQHRAVLHRREGVR